MGLKEGLGAAGRFRGEKSLRKVLFRGSDRNYDLVGAGGFLILYVLRALTFTRFRCTPRNFLHHTARYYRVNNKVWIKVYR